MMVLEDELVQEEENLMKTSKQEPLVYIQSKINGQSELVEKNRLKLCEKKVKR
jgi:hypothetical protein